MKYFIFMAFLTGCYLEPRVVKKETVRFVYEHSHSHERYEWRDGCRYEYYYLDKYNDELVYKRSRKHRRRGCRTFLYLKHSRVRYGR